MNIANYDADIIEATNNISNEAKSLYEKSEIILDRLMELQVPTNGIEVINEIPLQTFDLTQKCVSVLKEIENIVGATHQLYVLQTAKLYNIVVTISSRWGNLWILAVRAGKKIDNDTSLSAFQACMKEMSKLTFQGAFKTEFETQCKNMLVKTNPPDTGCFGVLILLITGAASLIGLTCWGISHLFA